MSKPSGPSPAFYNVVAESYDRMMSASASTLWERDAFRQLVVDTVGSGALLDFGCGTGTDAAWYARRGFRVLAYDNSQRMIDRAKRNHADLIENDALATYCSDYETFLEWRPETPVDAVVSNFAVLSHIDELSPLFETFGRQVAPKGCIVVSVLNPLFWKDMIHGWWWKSAWHSWGTGRICVRGGEVTTYRHYPATIIKAASPWFALKLRAGVGTLIRRHKRASEWSTPKTECSICQATSGMNNYHLGAELSRNRPL